MASFHRANYRISEFIRWSDQEELILQPKFQRRKAWDEPARSYLIDTVLRQLPMPKIYLRRVVDPQTGLKAYEVIDGQQRLSAIIDFHRGALALRKRHNPDLGDARFRTLPDSVQRAFLQYELSTEVMEDADDPEVWSLFERLNTYTLTLNEQERLNARFFGYFKQTAYEIAADEAALEAWTQIGIFSERQIARMREVELASDVLVAIVKGVSDKSEIRRAYKFFDDVFPAQETARRTFRDSLAFVSGPLLESVATTRFKNLAWFYSLMVVTADVIAGIPDGLGRSEFRPVPEISNRMREIDDILRPRDLPEGLIPLHSAMNRSTQHLRERKIRHEHFFRMMTFPEPSWKRVRYGAV